MDRVYRPGELAGSCRRVVPITAGQRLQITRERDLKLRLASIVASMVATLPFGSVRAQHAADNPVTSAEDAFGLTLGLESIGMYSPGQVRGFSPQTAGNVRIDGLYFDQQGSLSNRVVEGSTIRVGVSEIGYAFPAPTGIVDYELRRPGDGTPNATIIADGGPYQARGLSIDGSVPLAEKQLVLPIGVSTQISTQTPYGAYPGYTSTVTSAGATPQWKPNETVTVRALFDWQGTRNATTFPLFFPAVDFLPPPIGRGYLGQNWAQGRSMTENLGALVIAQLSGTWALAAGVFHSEADNPLSFADLYTDVAPSGRAEHLVVGYPDQSAASTSGEVRLKGRFTSGTWDHDVIFLARGRDILSRYGGDDVVDVGPTIIGTSAQVPEPRFVYTNRTKDRSELWSIGAAYQVDWRGLAELEMGVQQESYLKDVTSPGERPAELTDRPLRLYGNSAIALTHSLTLYTGYTQGLEDSGIAPSSAQNRGAVLPASLTWQLDSGLRYVVTPQLKFIAGVYELQKPYFNPDSSDIDRQLGVQQARGFELSISGKQLANFDINVGVLAARVSIVGPNLSAEGVGPIALGQPRLQYVANVNYTVPYWPALSLDLAATHFGSQPASIDNGSYSPAVTWLNLGARYRFSVFRKNSSLRVQIQNLSDSFWWTNVYTPGLFQWPAPRTVFAYLTTDL
jgi:iron complex outermembrane recepter protein